ncbi:putative monooxygenase [Leptospirillum ferrooxidans C2-3]|uniref:Putative monooxygenase n=1 Tax=Leptospirillum ferrooxidans (strain C2-3) TaxID=1162668 RepID=I0IMP9_LEPFC|nr:putative monooxygenase [Leptospirillum ferrooxidans C2-3]
MIPSGKDLLSLDHEYDVIVAGAGPGGLTLSCFLGKRGFRVLLVDPRESMSPLGRGELIQPLGLGILEDLGLLGPLLLQEHVRYDQFHFFGFDRKPLMTSSYQGKGLTYDWALSVEPYLQDSLMWKMLESLPSVTLFPGGRYLSHETRDNGVYVQIEKRGGVQTIQGKVLVGDDGRDSRLRKNLALPGVVKEYKDSYVSWSFEIPENLSLESPASDMSARYYLGPGEIFFLFATSSRKRFFLYMLKDRKIDEFVSRGNSDFLKRVDQCIPGLGDVLISAGFPGVSALKEWVIQKVDLEQWAKDYAVVIGDAAHATNPHVAQGRNQAMEDGRLLASHLETALSNPSTSLLDELRKFENIRITKTKALHHLADEMCFVWNSDNPLIVWGREQVFRGISKTPSLNRKIVRTIAGEDFLPLSLFDRINAFLKGLMQ